MPWKPCRGAARFALEREKPLGPLSSNWKTRDPGFPLVFTIGCLNRLSHQGRRTAWDLDSRWPVRLFATTVAICGLSQPLAPVLLSAFQWITPTVFLDGLRPRECKYSIG